MGRTKSDDRNHERSRSRKDKSGKEEAVSENVEKLRKLIRSIDTKHEKEALTGQERVEILKDIALANSILEQLQSQENGDANSSRGFDKATSKLGRLSVLTENKIENLRDDYRERSELLKKQKRVCLKHGDVEDIVFVLMRSITDHETFATGLEQESKKDSIRSHVIAKFKSIHQEISDLHGLIIGFIAQAAILMHDTTMAQEKFMVEAPYQQMLEAQIHMLLVARGYINIDDLAAKKLLKSVTRFKGACTALMSFLIRLKPELKLRLKTDDDKHRIGKNANDDDKDINERIKKISEKNKEQQKNKNKDEKNHKNEHKEENKQKHVDKDKDINKNEHKNKDVHKDKNTNKDVNKNKDTNKDKDKNIHKTENKNKEINKDKNKDINKDINKDKNKDINKDKNKDIHKTENKNKDINKDKNKDENKEKEKQINKNKDAKMNKVIMDRNPESNALINALRESITLSDTYKKLMDSEFKKPKATMKNLKYVVDPAIDLLEHKKNLHATAKNLLEKEHLKEGGYGRLLLEQSEKSGKPLRNMTEAYRAVEGLIEKACDIYKFLIKKSLQISELNATNANLKIPNDKPVEASIKVYSLAKSLSRLGGKFFALDKANDSALITSSTALKIKFSELRGYQNLVERVDPYGFITAQKEFIHAIKQVIHSGSELIRIKAESLHDPHDRNASKNQKALLLFHERCELCRSKAVKFTPIIAYLNDIYKSIARLRNEVLTRTQEKIRDNPDVIYSYDKSNSELNTIKDNANQTTLVYDSCRKEIIDHPNVDLENLSSKLFRNSIEKYNFSMVDKALDLSVIATKNDPEFILTKSPLELVDNSNIKPLLQSQLDMILAFQNAIFDRRLAYSFDKSFDTYAKVKDEFIHYLEDLLRKYYSTDNYLKKSYFNLKKMADQIISGEFSSNDIDQAFNEDLQRIPLRIYRRLDNIKKFYENSDSGQMIDELSNLTGLIKLLLKLTHRMIDREKCKIQFKPLWHQCALECIDIAIDLNSQLRKPFAIDNFKKIQNLSLDLQESVFTLINLALGQHNLGSLAEKQSNSGIDGKSRITSDDASALSSLSESNQKTESPSTQDSELAEEKEKNVALSKKLKDFLTVLLKYYKSYLSDQQGFTAHNISPYECKIMTQELSDNLAQLQKLNTGFIRSVTEGPKSYFKDFNYNFLQIKNLNQKIFDGALFLVPALFADHGFGMERRKLSQSPLKDLLDSQIQGIDCTEELYKTNDSKNWSKAFPIELEHISNLCERFRKFLSNISEKYILSLDAFNRLIKRLDDNIKQVRKDGFLDNDIHKLSDILRNAKELADKYYGIQKTGTRAADLVPDEKFLSNLIDMQEQLVRSISNYVKDSTIKDKMNEDLVNLLDLTRRIIAEIYEQGADIEFDVRAQAYEANNLLKSIVDNLESGITIKDPNQKNKDADPDKINKNENKMKKDNKNEAKKEEKEKKDQKAEEKPKATPVDKNAGQKPASTRDKSKLYTSPDDREFIQRLILKVRHTKSMLLNGGYENSIDPRVTYKPIGEIGNAINHYLTKSGDYLSDNISPNIGILSLLVDDSDLITTNACNYARKMTDFEELELQEYLNKILSLLTGIQDPSDDHKNIQLIHSIFGAENALKNLLHSLQANQGGKNKNPMDKKGLSDSATSIDVGSTESLSDSDSSNHAKERRPLKIWDSSKDPLVIKINELVASNSKKEIQAIKDALVVKNSSTECFDTLEDLEGQFNILRSQIRDRIDPTIKRTMVENLNSNLSKDFIEFLRGRFNEHGKSPYSFAAKLPLTPFQNAERELYISLRENKNDIQERTNDFVVEGNNLKKFLMRSDAVRPKKISNDKDKHNIDNRGKSPRKESPKPPAKNAQKDDPHKKNDKNVSKPTNDHKKQPIEKRRNPSRDAKESEDDKKNKANRKIKSKPLEMVAKKINSDKIKAPKASEKRLMDSKLLTNVSIDHLNNSRTPKASNEKMLADALDTYLGQAFAQAKNKSNPKSKGLALDIITEADKALDVKNDRAQQERIRTAIRKFEESLDLKLKRNDDDELNNMIDKFNSKLKNDLSELNNFRKNRSKPNTYDIELGPLYDLVIRSIDESIRLVNSEITASEALLDKNFGDAHIKTQNLRYAAFIANLNEINGESLVYYLRAYKLFAKREIDSQSMFMDATKNIISTLVHKKKYSTVLKELLREKHEEVESNSGKLQRTLEAIEKILKEKKFSERNGETDSETTSRISSFDNNDSDFDEAQAHHHNKINRFIKKFDVTDGINRFDRTLDKAVKDQM